MREHHDAEAKIESEAPRRAYTYWNSGAELAHMRLAQEAYLVSGPALGLGDFAVHVHRLRWKDSRIVLTVEQSAANE